MRYALAVALSALLSGCTIEVVADNIEGSFTKSLTVEGPVTLEVKSRSGSIEVTGSEGDEVQVYGKIRAQWGLDREQAEERVRAIEANPPVELRDGVVVVGEPAAPEMFDKVSVSYEIAVPRRARVTLRGSSGSQTVEDVAGPVDLDARSGSVHVRRVEQDVNVHVSSGSLTVEDVGGALTAESNSGSQTLRRIAGAVRTRASSGSVKLEEMGGEVSVRSSSGSVRVEQAAAAPVTVNASSGSIRVETVAGSGYDFDIETRSGGIGLPDGASLTLDGKRHKKGALRGGGPLLTLQASSGGVDVR
jgi:DUF4097 and DUF4098 domain-containing protein YvlB